MSLRQHKANKKLRPGALFNKTSFSKRSLLFFVLVFASIGSYIIWRSFAAPTPPTIYLSPASQTLAINTTFSIQVRENSGATAVNAVQANFSYPASLVDFVSINTTGSAFTTDALLSGGSGQVNIARGVTTSVTGDQLVATVTFKTKVTGGSVGMAFTSGTFLVSSATNTDILGSLAATAGGTYTVDTTPPTISPTAPSDGATLASGSTVTISVSATDNDRVVSVDIYIDGVKTTTLASSPYNYNWNTSGYSLGAHTINATATDPSGNLQGFKPISVTLTDQTAPSVPGNFRAAANSLTSISLAWNASTDNVAVTNYQLKRGSTVIATLPAASLTYADSSLASNTSYSYSIKALDAAGNASAAAPLSASTTSIKPGDLNGDNLVDIFDLSILLSHFGTSSATADINHDGTVDIFDLSILLSHFGT